VFNKIFILKEKFYTTNIHLNMRGLLRDIKGQMGR